MNSQVRKLFLLVLVMFLVLGSAVTLVQFVAAPGLYANPYNSRRLVQAAERDRGPIIVAGNPIAYSERVNASNKFQRTYAEGPTYAAVTGYFSAANFYATELEEAADEILEGDTSELFWQRLRSLVAGRPRQGGGVELTLDPALQKEAAAALAGRKGAVVAMNARTGAILALYSSPSYDPNPLASLDYDVAGESTQQLQGDPDRPLTNRAIAGDRYHPGSVFKLLTAAVMLEDGIGPDTLLDSPPSITLPQTDVTLSNIEGDDCGSGNVSLTEAFARSCNTTFALATEKMKDNELGAMAERFGFGTSFDVPMPVTASYFPEVLTPPELAMSAIGQFDVSVTPMQMAMVTAAIANDGKMMQPYLIDAVVDSDNKQLSVTKPREISQPIKPEIASQLGAMMVQVVEAPYGTGAQMAIPGLTVAAKTGTAETGIEDMTDAWAVAYAPAGILAEDSANVAPIVVAVVVEGDDADPSPHGGPVAGPIARALLEVANNEH